MKLVDRNKLLEYFEELKGIGIGPEGPQVPPLQRGIQQAGEEAGPIHARIDSVEQSLKQWKTVHRRKKKKVAVNRLEKASNELPGLDVVSGILEDEDVADQVQEDFGGRGAWGGCGGGLNQVCHGPNLLVQQNCVTVTGFKDECSNYCKLIYQCCCAKLMFDGPEIERVQIYHQTTFDCGGGGCS